MDKGQLNNAAVWAVVALLTGGGAGLYPQLATKADVIAVEQRLNNKVDAFSGGVYELFLENVNETIIELEGTVAKSQEQNQTLVRMRIRKEKLLRVLNQEAAK